MQGAAKLGLLDGFASTLPMSREEMVLGFGRVTVYGAAKKQQGSLLLPPCSLVPNHGTLGAPKLVVAALRESKESCFPVSTARARQEYGRSTAGVRQRTISCRTCLTYVWSLSPGCLITPCVFPRHVSDGGGTSEIIHQVSSCSK